MQSDHGGSQFLAFAILFLVLGLQIGVQFWKKYFPKSFQYTTFVLMWVFPAGLSLYLGFWKMILLWAIFSSVSLYMAYLGTRKPLSMRTPRRVYSWFYWIYLIAHLLSIVGFFLLCLDIFGITNFFHGMFLKQLLEYRVFRFLYSEPIVIVFYGLYYSIIVRDFAEICAEQMAQNIEESRVQYYVNENAIKRTCGICNGGFELDRDLEGAAQLQTEFISDNKLEVECGHCFHEFCVKGWSIIGKKDHCPVCKEKVNIKDKLPKSPWADQDSPAWQQFLDIVRYIIVWNPLILLVLQVLLTIVKF